MAFFIAPIPSSRRLVARATAFENLPDWLSRNDVKTYLGISLASVDHLIKKLPHKKFGKHVRVAKHLIAPKASPVDIGKLSRDAIAQALRNSKTPARTKTFITKELARRGIKVPR